MPSRGMQVLNLLSIYVSLSLSLLICNNNNNNTHYLLFDKDTCYYYYCYYYYKAFQSLTASPSLILRRSKWAKRCLGGKFLVALFMRKDLPEIPRGSARFLALPNLAVTICNLLPLEFNLMPMLLYWHIVVD